MKNILIIGAGGIGSFLIPEVANCRRNGQITDTHITIADGDIVELDQIKYQNFFINQIGNNKAETLKAVDEGGIDEAIKERIGYIHSKLEGYTSLAPMPSNYKKGDKVNVKRLNPDIVILCVDNDRTREMVIKYCFDSNKQFIDLRATGRSIFAMPKLKQLEDNLKFVEDDGKEYSCQDKEDLEKGLYQYGNRIVAQIGVQMLLNLLRGHNNRVINMVI